MIKASNILIFCVLMVKVLISFQNVGAVYGFFLFFFNRKRNLLLLVCLLLIQISNCQRRNLSQLGIIEGIVFLIYDLLVIVTLISNLLRFILQTCFLNLWVIIRIIVQFKSWIPKTFESYFDTVSFSILNSDYVNKSLVLFFLTMYNFCNTFLFCLIQYFILTIITWACQITVRRLIYENLTKLISKETLLRLK